MSHSLVFPKTIYIPHGWDDALWQRAVAFWEERGFTFSERRGEQQIGKRGSFWGNCTAIDMSRLRATMTVTRLDISRVEFVMEVDTAMQIITDFNQEYWIREMDTLETWLLEGDKKEEEWQAFDAKWRRATWRWIISLGGAKSNLPPR